MSDKKFESEQHSVSLTARKQADIHGVVEVESFDEETVILTTVCGEMTIEGEQLHVGTLDMERGVVCVDGQIRGIWYADAATTRKKGLWGLFR